MGVIVIGLGTPQSTRVNFGCTWEHLGTRTTSLGVPTTHLGAPATSLRAPATTLGAPSITVKRSGKYVFQNAAGIPGNHSYYLSFNDC
jgi:hypothetical protein